MSLRATAPCASNWPAAWAVDRGPAAIPYQGVAACLSGHAEAAAAALTSWPVRGAVTIVTKSLKIHGMDAPHVALRSMRNGGETAGLELLDTLERGVTRAMLHLAWVMSQRTARMVGRAPNQATRRLSSCWSASIRFGQGF